MQDKESQIPVQYYEIGKVIEDYKRVIYQKFRTNQAQLVEELQTKAKKLKQSIVFYKKQNSPQNIQKLISKKRYEKQAERLELEVQWRKLTQKYKKLQEEQKKINQENRENKFDLENLQRKISQLREENKLMNLKVQKLKQQMQSEHFITQIKTSYSSPYKFRPKEEQVQKIKSSLTLQKNSANFRLKIEKKYKNQDKQNVQVDKNTEGQKNKNEFQKNKQIEQLQAKKHNFLIKNQDKNSEFEIKNLYSYQQAKKSQKTNNYPFGKGEKWAQLMHYLNKPQVRDKIFDLVRK